MDKNTDNFPTTQIELISNTQINGDTKQENTQQILTNQINENIESNLNTEIIEDTDTVQVSTSQISDYITNNMNRTKNISSEYTTSQITTSPINTIFTTISYRDNNESISTKVPSIINSRSIITTIYNISSTFVEIHASSNIIKALEATTIIKDEPTLIVFLGFSHFRIYE